MAAWPTSRRLVALAIERVGGGSPTALANELRLGANGYQKVNRWKKGGALSYEDAMKMLAKLGWLNTSAMTGEADPDQEESGDPLEALAETVARGFEALGVAPARLRPAEGGPSHTGEAGQQ